MKVRKHFFISNDHCVFCGALAWTKVQKQFSDRGQAVPQTDERSCLERDDHVNPNELRPEPTLRQISCEDADSIKAAIDALRAAKQEQPEPTTATVDEWSIFFGTPKIGQTLTITNATDRLLYLSEKRIG